MLEPKKIKYRKVHRGNRKGMAKGGTEVNFGSYGMKAMEPGWITARLGIVIGRGGGQDV